MAIINVNVVLPERQNAFFQAMADLLPREIFNVDQEFMIPRLQAVPITGTVVAFSTVKLFINGVDRSPVPDIVADADGNWSTAINLTPGQNTIQVQFFPPELTVSIDSAPSPTLTVDNVLVHPTLFSPFGLGAVIRDIVMDGSNLYLGGTTGTGSNLIAKYDMTTGVGVFLPYGIVAPSSGDVRTFEIDANWLYSAQTLGDASIKVSRYNKTLTTRTDLAYATVPNSMRSDTTNLFVVRSGTGGVLLTKVAPATMTLVGAEVNIQAGSPSAGHEAISDDGANLMISTFYTIAGESFTNSISAGSPDLGANYIPWNLLQHKKVRKSDLVVLGTFTTYSSFVAGQENYTPKNSLVYLGGFYYALALCNPGKVIKMQEGTVDGLPALKPIDVIPLPISTTGVDTSLATRMRLGPDSRLYVAGTAGMARFTPGSTSVQYMPRGAVAITSTLNDVAVVDDTILDRAIAAPIGIFTDRAQTYTIVAPAAPPTNVRCHYNNTHTAVGVGWNSTGDGSGYIVEQAVNAGAFAEAKREYFGNGAFIQASLLPVFHSGDTLRYRVRAFNQVGTSIPSAETTFAVPYLTPPLGNCTALAPTSVVGNAVTLNFNDGEITLGGPINATTNRYHVLFLYRSADGMTGWTQVGARSMIPDAVQPDGTPIGGAFYYNPFTRANTNVTMVDNTAGAYPYFYQVRAEQRDGPSLSFPSIVYGPGAYSNVLQVDAPPAIPTGVTVTSAWEGVVVRWTAGVGGGSVTGYGIERSTNNGGSFSPLTTVGLVTKYIDTAAIGQPQVMYRIYASGPGGNSANSANSANTAPVYKEIVSLGNFQSIVGDATYLYIAALANGSMVAIERVSKADSSLRTTFPAVYTGTGSVALHRMVFIGSQIFASIKDTAEASAKIIRIDPSTMTTTGSISTGAGTQGIEFITDGSNNWLLTATPNKIVKFDPVGLSITQTGPTFDSNNHYQSGLYLSGDIYVSYSGVGFFVPYIDRISTTTLAAVETLDQQAHATGVSQRILSIGSNIYALMGNGIHKYSIGPLTWVSSGGGSTAYRGAVVVGTNIYCVGNATNGISKVNSTPAFVSNLTNTHLSQGADAHADATHVYISNMASAIVAREVLASF